MGEALHGRRAREAWAQWGTRCTSRRNAPFSPFHLPFEVALMTPSADEPTGSFDAPARPPRMLAWTLVAIALFFFLAGLHVVDGSRLMAAVVYKGLLIALGGIGGYWLDRELFPYARPHRCMDFEPLDPQPGESLSPLGRDMHETESSYLQIASSDYTVAMIRRAIIMAACLICVGVSGHAVFVPTL
jgi:hypothetical protein